MNCQNVRSLRRWRATNENASGFAAKTATITKPTNDGVLDLRFGTLNGPLPRYMKLWPILLGSDNDVSSMRILGWHSVVLDGSNTLWVPTPIGEFACTASTFVGVAGSAVLDTERFCDTIAPVALMTRDNKIAAGTSLTSDYGYLTPANNYPAHILMPLAGFELYEVLSDQTTGTATFNVLYSLLD